MAQGVTDEKWREAVAALARLADLSSISQAAEEVGVPEANARRWIAAKGEIGAQGKNRRLLLEWHKAGQGGATRHDTPPIPNAPQGVLTGRSVEVEALLAYAIERQRLITMELRRMDNVSAGAPPRTGSD